MKLSELVNKLQHEQVHAQSRGEDPEVHAAVFLSEGQGPWPGRVTGAEAKDDSSGFVLSVAISSDVL